MKRFVPMVLLFLGCGLAASFGARNGDEHAAHRVALWEASETGSEVAVALPGPMARLVGWLQVGGVGFGAGVVLIGAGAMMARRQLAASSRGEGDSAAALVDFESTVEEILAEIDAMTVELDAVEMEDTAPELRERLDLLAEQKIGPLVDGRGQLVARHGIGPFAEYFGLFSGGERNLARVWSALTDGHAVVAQQSIVTARVGFAEALDAYRAAESKG